MAATYTCRRISTKALTRYQIILLGEQRHIGVNNLPKVVARQCSGRKSNPRSSHRESSALTTTPPSRLATISINYASNFLSYSCLFVCVFFFHCLLLLPADKICVNNETIQDRTPRLRTDIQSSFLHSQFITLFLPHLRILGVPAQLRPRLIFPTF